MEAALASYEELHKYMPQRPPMVMVDHLLQNDEKESRSCFTVKEEQLFLEEGRFREAGLVENIAQTAAAGVGYHFIEERGEGDEPPLGFIASVKDLKVHELPLIGDELLTKVRVKQEVVQVTIIQAEVRKGETLLLECEMRIHLPEESSSGEGP